LLRVKELKEALGDKILINGIPATHFLPSISVEEPKRFVNALFKTFSPNIIVGISDMLPPDGSIDKVRIVGERLLEITPP